MTRRPCSPVPSIQRIGLGRAPRRFGRGRPRGVGAALVTIAISLLSACCISAAAAAVPALEWSTPRHVGTNMLSGVSCPNVAFCYAIEDYSTGGGLGALISTDAQVAEPTWTPTPVESQYFTEAVSCASELLCVVGNSSRNVLASTDSDAPTPSYVTTPIPSGPIFALSCTSVSFCVAATGTGDIAISHDPGGESPTWSESALNDTQELNAVSCVETKLCVTGGSVAATENEGVILNSPNPAAPTPVWNPVRVGVEQFIYSVSCSSTALCVAGTWGAIFTSTDPTAANPVWERTRVDAPHGIVAISCASNELCVGVDNAGNAIVSTNPGAPAPTWTAKDIDGNTELRAVSCPSISLCVATDSAGNIVVGKATSEPPDAPETGPSKPTGAQKTGDTQPAGAQTAGASTAEAQTTSAQSTGSGNTGAPTDRPTHRTPAPIARFSPVFTTRASLRRRTIGLLTGLPVIGSLPLNATVVVRCRRSCERRITLVRHTRTHHNIALPFREPLVLAPTTTIEIAVTAPHLTGRYVDYAFKRTADTAIPYITQDGCLTNTGAHQPCS
jgi:hypothetical protein